MPRFLLATTLLAGVAAASPALAQTGYGNSNSYANGYGNGYAPGYSNTYMDDWTDRSGFDTRLNQIELRVQDGITAGTIDRREANRLRGQLRYLRQLEYRYSSNGISATERTDLQQRMRTLRHDVRIADGRRDDYRYGYDDNRYNGANGNGYYNGANGNGYYGQGGPYEGVSDACARSNSGLAGIVNNLVGAGCLRVGDRATGNLYGVPSQYRDRYRDGGGYYYRSDGRAIYRIDSRNNTVVDVYSVDR